MADLGLAVNDICSETLQCSHCLVGMRHRHGRVLGTVGDVEGFPGQGEAGFQQLPTCGQKTGQAGSSLDPVRVKQGCGIGRGGPLAESHQVDLAGVDLCLSGPGIDPFKQSSDGRLVILDGSRRS